MPCCQACLCTRLPGRVRPGTCTSPGQNGLQVHPLLYRCCPLALPGTCTGAVRPLLCACSSKRLGSCNDFTHRNGPSQAPQIPQGVQTWQARRDGEHQPGLDVDPASQPAPHKRQQVPACSSSASDKRRTDWAARGHQQAVRQWTRACSGAHLHAPELLCATRTSMPAPRPPTKPAGRQHRCAPQQS